MSLSEKFREITQRDDYFQQVNRKVQEKLPSDLRNLKFRHTSGNNWIVFRYPQFKYTQYELHFSPCSKHHAEYFGEGYLEVLSVYFGGKSTKIEKRQAWLEAIQPYVETISRQLKREVVAGPWGKHWVWLAVNLADEDFREDPDLYSSIIVDFLKATFDPVSLAFKATRG